MKSQHQEVLTNQGSRMRRSQSINKEIMQIEKGLIPIHWIRAQTTHIDTQKITVQDTEIDQNQPPRPENLKTRIINTEREVP